MRFFTILSLITLSIILISSGNKSTKHPGYDGFAFRSGGFDVVLDLPDTPYDYTNVELPVHYENLIGMFGAPSLGEEVSNEGATLGRVIFYDKNMSLNNTVACATCHLQEKGFADDLAFSEGFDGALTSRNSLNIADFGFTHYPAFFWDDSETSLEEMVILPFQNGDEMGMTMDEIVSRMEGTDYYPGLFSDAFGTEQITSERIGDALSQFLRSMYMVDTKLDQGIANGFADFTADELDGLDIFAQNCQNCHSQTITSEDPFMNELFFQMFEFLGPHNTGLDLLLDDYGVANHTGEVTDEGKFKTPNLKNVELTGPYMHDGRFETLRDVIDFYSDGILPHPNTIFTAHFHYTDESIFPQPFTGFDFTEDQKNSLEAFLLTLTDEGMMTDVRFSDPFVLEDAVDIEEINAIAFTAYPNPFTDQLQVQFENTSASLATVKLFDVKGQLLQHGVTMGNTYTLDRGDLPAGNYLVEVMIDGEQGLKKISAQ